MIQANIKIHHNVITGDNKMVETKLNTDTISSEEKAKWMRKAYSDTSNAIANEANMKQKVKQKLLDTLNYAIENTNKKVSEYTLSSFNKIFTPTSNNYTKVTLRYGSVVFYKSIIEDSILCFSSKTGEVNGTDNFKAKKYILEGIVDDVNDSKWFDKQYKEFLDNKKTAQAKAKKTREKNKKKKANAE